MNDKSTNESGILTVLYRSERAPQIPINTSDLSTILDHISFRDYYCPGNTNTPLSEYDDTGQVIDHFDELVEPHKEGKLNNPTRKIRHQDILLTTYKEPPRRHCYLLVDKLEKKDYTKALKSCEKLEEVGLYPEPITDRFHALTLSGELDGYEDVPDIIENNVPEDEILDPSLTDPSYNLEPETNTKHELYIVSAFEMVWPDKVFKKSFTVREKAVISPFLDYIHVGKSKHYNRLNAGFSDEALELEKMAVNMNRIYSHLVAFAWVPGYPCTIAPLFPDNMPIAFKPFQETVAEFWDIYGENDQAIREFKAVAEKAEQWAAEHLGCAVKRIWDSEQKNLYFPICLGEPR